MIMRSRDTEKKIENLQEWKLRKHQMLHIKEKKNNENTCGFSETKAKTEKKR